MRTSPGAALWRLAILAAAAALLAFGFLQDGCERVSGPRAPWVAAPDTFRFADLDALRARFRDEGFGRDDWEAGERTVPRLYLAEVPERWRTKVAPSLPVETKKQYFFLVYLPLVLQADEQIAADRARLLELAARDARSPEEDAWLRALAGQYFLDAATLDDALLARLRRRVDIVPPSLALAQAAIESGWSTSRFADEGNALFGQWTWKKDGLTPTARRDSLGAYRIRTFDTPGHSIAAYMHNLNTHRSYREFRAARARIRDRAAEPTGAALAPTLTSYSEQGEEYVQKLLSVIRVNGLEEMDQARLRDMRPVMLVPVGEGAD